jgi:hypothetical protein
VPDARKSSTTNTRSADVRNSDATAAQSWGHIH